MKRLIFLSLCTFLINTNTFAQLDKLCPVSSTVYAPSTLEDVQLLLNTKDFRPYTIPFGKTETTSSIQLVNLNHPFPPIWYQMGNPELDKGGNFVETTFLLDAKIQKNGGQLTFLGSYPNEFYGGVAIDTSTLLSIDTIKNYYPETSDTIRQTIDLHDLQIDKYGNKLLSNQVVRTVDVRCLSGLEEDSIRFALVNDIIIINPFDSIIFRWNPLDHLSICEMNWAYKEASMTYGSTINWSHINSARFAKDGNIIYSYRHIGLGKINRLTGDIMWKLGGKDSIHAISLKDTDNYYLQHDFSQQEDGLYTVFSNGDDEHPYLEGLIYEIDEVNKKAKLINRYKLDPETFSKALGNYDCYNDTCLINFGLLLNGNKEGTQEVARILVKNKIAAKISMKANNFAYQIHTTSWNANTNRPKIVFNKKTKTIATEKKDGLYNYTWYKIDSTSAIRVGNGLSYLPTERGNYVVEAKKGDGIFTSYIVSELYYYGKKSKR